MSFKDISYLELWWPLCSAEQKHLCNFGRMHHEEQCCEIILNLDQWFRRKCSLNIFLNRSSGSPFVQWSGTIFVKLVEGIRRNNSVKLFLNVDQWLWGKCCLLSRALAARFVQWSRIICAILVEGIIAPDKDWMQLGIYPPLFGLIGYFKF